MEYRVGTTGAFTPVGGSFIDVKTANWTATRTFQIRVAATASEFASATINVSVPARPAMPSVVYNSTTDAITGVRTTMEFSLDGDDWTIVTSTAIPRAQIGSATQVFIRVRATATVPASLSMTITVPAPITP